jgi:UDP-N-acetylmuramate--alanine ligase
MEAYGSYADLESAFVEFAGKVPFYGAVVACADDELLRAILPRLTRRTVTYGIDHTDAQLVATDVVLEGFGSHCRVIRRDAHRAGAREVLGDLHLQVPGRHSVLNALAAVAIALELDVPFARIAEALGAFRGADRRFQRVGEVNGVVVVDDYGHHPTEIAAVLAAARAARPARVVLAFQPHRFTRTRDLLPDFARTLATADAVVLTDIYPAGEAPIPGVTIEALAAAVTAEHGTPVQVVPDLSALPAAVVQVARPGDLVITLGAGSIGGTATRVVAALSAASGTGGTA